MSKLLQLIQKVYLMILTICLYHVFLFKLISIPKLEKNTLKHTTIWQEI